MAVAAAIRVSVPDSPLFGPRLVFRPAEGGAQRVALCFCPPHERLAPAPPFPASATQQLYFISAAPLSGPRPDRTRVSPRARGR